MYTCCVYFLCGVCVYVCMLCIYYCVVCMSVCMLCVISGWKSSGLCCCMVCMCVCYAYIIVWCVCVRYVLFLGRSLLAYVVVWCMCCIHVVWNVCAMCMLLYGVYVCALCYFWVQIFWACVDSFRPPSIFTFFWIFSTFQLCPALPVQKQIPQKHQHRIPSLHIKTAMLGIKTRKISAMKLA